MPVKRAIGPVRVPVVLRTPSVIEPVEVTAIAVGTAVEILVIVVAFRYDGVLGALDHFHVIGNPLVLYGAQLGVTTGQQHHKQSGDEWRRAQGEAIASPLV